MEDHSKHDAEAKELINKHVKEHGCHLAMLEATDYLPSFVYSIGLFKNYNHAEIICFGLETDLMGHLINYARNQIQLGGKFQSGILYDDFLEGYPVQFLEVDKSYYQNYVGYGGWFYSSFDFPLLQLIWPDKQGHFPWEEGFNQVWLRKQPLLDRGTDFKFYEDRRCCVFTTKQVLNGDPILYIYHDENGDWQFHSSDSPHIDDAKVVAFEEITKIDPPVNEMYHLEYGWYASRSGKDKEWHYEVNPDKEEPAEDDDE